MQKELFPMFGMMPAINIPFTEDDKIDFNGLQKHLDNAIESGICGFLIPVVASEVNKLTACERDSIIQAAIEANNHRVPLIGGASALSKEECLDNVKGLLKYDIEGVLANIPYQNEQQYTGYVRSIAELGPKFLMIQDYNVDGGGVPVPLIIRLFEETACFRSIKIETQAPGPKYTAVLEASNCQLHVAGGWSITNIIEAWDRGVHAMANTGLNEPFCKIYDLYRKGRRDKAVLLFEKLQPIITFSNQCLDLSIHFYKRLLYRQGIYKTPKVRKPIMDFDSHYQKYGDEMIDKAISLIKEIKGGVYDAEDN
jgi:4-hydroxy-tetrahydrodipicolinate synthase